MITTTPTHTPRIWAGTVIVGWLASGRATQPAHVWRELEIRRIGSTRARDWARAAPEAERLAALTRILVWCAHRQHDRTPLRDYHAHHAREYRVTKKLWARDVAGWCGWRESRVFDLEQHKAFCSPSLLAMFAAVEDLTNGQAT